MIWMENYNLRCHSPEGYTTFGGTDGRGGVSSAQHAVGEAKSLDSSLCSEWKFIRLNVTDYKVEITILSP
jgi:hypothetical protein